MGLIGKLIDAIFGADKGAIKEVAEVFRVNAENASQREHDVQIAALDQYAQEFRVYERGRFDRFMDALNRIPRPALAFGTIALFIAAMVDPVWFSARMTGLALVPEPLWWLLGAIVTFYFGARHQSKGQEFTRDLAEKMAQNAPRIVRTIEEIEAVETAPVRTADSETDDGLFTVNDPNPILDKLTK